MSSMYTQINEFKEVLCRTNVIDELVELLFVTYNGVKPSSELSEIDRTRTQNEASSDVKNPCQPISNSLLDLLLIIASDSILGSWKSWQGIDLILRAMPTPVHEDFLVFQTSILSRLIDLLQKKLKSRKGYFSDSKVLAGLSKFIEMVVDRIYAGILFG